MGKMEQFQKSMESVNEQWKAGELTRAKYQAAVLHNLEAAGLADQNMTIQWSGEVPQVSIFE